MHFYGTIGPACASAGTLRRLVDAGMTGLRMNLSHGALAEHADWLAMIHAVGIPDLLIDLQGPELRVGRLASPVTLPEGGIGLDVGCGSGALTIACAKRNPQGKMIGIDRWGKEYASFSLPLCEKNAAAEGVKNALFRRGNAVKLDFPDESFDAVTSNYVYHNITGEDKQALLLETLRVLKKGGTFAIHDLMSERRYGDMQAFVQKLREMGYERVELIDTTTGKFMTPKEAKRLMLHGSTLLVGRK